MYICIYIYMNMYMMMRVRGHRLGSEGRVARVGSQDAGWRILHSYQNNALG
jgi:hypothetical protein